MTEGDEAAYHIFRRCGPMRATIIETDGWTAFVEVEWLPTPHRSRRVVPLSTLSPWTPMDDQYWHESAERLREVKAKERALLARLAKLHEKGSHHAHSARDAEAVPQRLEAPVEVCPLFAGQGEV